MSKKDNNNRPIPKRHHSKDKSNSGNYLPATIAKLEAYLKQNKKVYVRKMSFHKNDEILQHPIDSESVPPMEQYKQDFNKLLNWNIVKEEKGIR